MMTIAIDSALPPAVLRDVGTMISNFRAKRQAVRVVRLHVDDYMMMLRAVGSNVFTPYTPTICGVPVEPWERSEVGVFAVADDNTPLTASGGLVREEVG
jgi:hypothetical protein